VLREDARIGDLLVVELGDEIVNALVHVRNDRKRIAFFMFARSRITGGVDTVGTTPVVGRFLTSILPSICLVVLFVEFLYNLL